MTLSLSRTFQAPFWGDVSFERWQEGTESENNPQSRQLKSSTCLNKEHHDARDLLRLEEAFYKP